MRNRQASPCAEHKRSTGEGARMARDCTPAMVTGMAATLHRVSRVGMLRTCMCIIPTSTFMACMVVMSSAESAGCGSGGCLGCCAAFSLFAVWALRAWCRRSAMRVPTPCRPRAHHACEIMNVMAGSSGCKRSLKMEKSWFTCISAAYDFTCVQASSRGGRAMLSAGGRWGCQRCNQLRAPGQTAVNGLVCHKIDPSSKVLWASLHQLASLSLQESRHAFGRAMRKERTGYAHIADAMSAGISLTRCHKIKRASWPI